MKLFARSTFSIIIAAGGLTLPAPAETNQSQQIAAAVLPLPPSMRADATVVSMAEDGKTTVLRQGTNGLFCAEHLTDKMFVAHCFPESMREAVVRRGELTREAGKNASAAKIDEEMNREIKAGKIHLPEHPVVMYQMRGPINGYDPATNQATSAIKTWQMIMTPYATGATLGLPDKKTEGAPWVMNAGTWGAHIMVEH